MPVKWKPNYTEDEVEALVELYAEVDLSRIGLQWRVRFWDLKQALLLMPPKEYQAVLLIGLIGIDTRWAGRLMGASHDTMWRRYRRGLEYLTLILNGRHPHH